MARVAALINASKHLGMRVALDYPCVGFQATALT
jgi:hypothetical protein